MNFKLLDGTGDVQVATNKVTKQVAITGKGQFFEKNHQWFTKAIPWSTRILVPFKSAKRKGVSIDLDIDLAKAQSKLPSPLDTKTLENKTMTVNTVIDNNLVNSELNLPGLVNVNLTWKEQQGGFKLISNKVWLGSLPQTSKNKQNAFYIKGEIERLSLDDWIPISKKLNFSSQNDNEGSKKVIWDESSVLVKNTQFLSHDYSDLQISLKSNVDKPLAINLTNKDVEASVSFSSANCHCTLYS